MDLKITNSFTHLLIKNENIGEFKQSGIEEKILLKFLLPILGFPAIFDCQLIDTVDGEYDGNF